ncbi:MAG TPA: hypothetical protein VMP42_01275 [Actinomycetota bacterium]|nr:hypothetical protein [Actinomycetota bacterium]
MSRGRAAGLALAVVLGASCSGDRPAPDPPEAGARPRCEALPGRAPEGFVLVEARDVPSSSHIGTRRSYRDPVGARLEILLGAVGQVGEGLRLVEERVLPSGAPARLLGEGRVWALAWEGDPPCLRNAIISEGLGRSGFLSVLEGMGLVA